MPSLQKKITLNKLAIASSAAGAVESASLATAYGGLFGEFFHSPVGTAISTVGSQVLYPVIMATAALEAILSWIRVHQDRNKQNKVKTRNVVNASISTTAFAGFSVALIGLLVAAPIFAQASSIIFMAIIGARSLYNLGAGIYYKYRASKMDDDTNKDKYHARGNEHIKNGVLGLVGFAVVTAVFLLGYFVAAPVGIALNGFFTLMAVIGVVKGIRNHMQLNKQSQSLLQDDEHAQPHQLPRPSLVIKRSASRLIHGPALNQPTVAVSVKAKSFEDKKSSGYVENSLLGGSGRQRAASLTDSENRIAQVANMK